MTDPISQVTLFLAFEPHSAKVTPLSFCEYLRNNQSDSFVEFGYLHPIIRRNWLVEHQIKYQEHLRLGEDMMFLFECFHGAKAILLSSPTIVAVYNTVARSE